MLECTEASKTVCYWLVPANLSKKTEQKKVEQQTIKLQEANNYIPFQM